MSESLTTSFTLEQLAEIEAIRQLKADYWWYIDNKDWTAWKTVFTEDVKFIMNGQEVLHGVDAMVEMVSGSLKDMVTAHQGHQSKIEFTGPDRAKGRFILNDTLKSTEKVVMRGYGYYLDELEKGKDGKWRIKSLTLGYFFTENFA